MATASPCREPTTACTNCRNTRANCCGSSKANTRPKVSCDGTPFGSSRNFSNHFCLLIPNSSTSTQPSHPAKNPHTAMTKISTSLCRRFRLTLGSATLSKKINGLVITGRDMILLHEEMVYIHPEKNYSLPPCPRLLNSSYNLR